MKNKKSLIIILLAVSVITGCISLTDDIELRKNRYGYSELQLMDLNFTITDEYDDGPYLFYGENGLQQHEIVKGKLITTRVTDHYPESFAPASSKIAFNGKIAALSDIHGQFDVFTSLLESNGIVDDQLKWQFGDGMLVITGDVFDRGPQVLDILWMLYRLEQEAKTQGGQVQFLLGNHEHMVLAGDLRYLHDFYDKTAELFGREYHHLFDNQSVLGRWLRSKSTLLQVNDTLFVHGGLSSQFVEQGLDIEKINKGYRASIDAAADPNGNFAPLHDRDSPIWYRGYFLDRNLDQDTVDALMAKAGVSRIVVGHTSMQAVTAYFNNKVIAVDTSIKKGKQGELLFIDGQKLIRATFQGEQVPLN